jgi:hypothetical protein
MMFPDLAHVDNNAADDSPVVIAFKDHDFDADTEDGAPNNAVGTILLVLMLMTLLLLYHLNHYYAKSKALCR